MRRDMKCNIVNLTRMFVCFFKEVYRSSSAGGRKFKLSERKSNFFRNKNVFTKNQDKNLGRVQQPEEAEGAKIPAH